MGLSVKEGDIIKNMKSRLYRELVSKTIPSSHKQCNVRINNKAVKSNRLASRQSAQNQTFMTLGSSPRAGVICCVTRFYECYASCSNCSFVSNII